MSGLHIHKFDIAVDPPALWEGQEALISNRHPG